MPTPSNRSGAYLDSLDSTHSVLEAKPLHHAVPRRITEIETGVSILFPVLLRVTPCNSVVDSSVPIVPSVVKLPQSMHPGTVSHDSTHSTPAPIQTHIHSPVPILTATNIRHAFGDRLILDSVSLSIEPDERVGVVGRNGTGKSTLLRAMGGLLKPDAGDISLRKGARVGFLHQDPQFPKGTTLRDAAAEGFAELVDLHHQLDAVFYDMEGAQGDALEKLLHRQSNLERRIQAAGGYAIDHKIDAVLHGLGFSDPQFSLPVEKLSGGQRSRVALAKLLIEDPDVILLDEPTNHLDIDGRIWLENFLADEFKGAVVLISHDRYLLDRVVDRIVEVERTRLIDYPGNYSAFRRLRAERREAHGRAWEAEQRQFKREEAFIRKYKAGQRAKQARGRESRLDRARAGSELEKPLERGTFTFNLPKAERPGDLIFVARDLAKRYTRDDGSTLTLFEGLTVTIERGKRWGIVGPNGAGKTTLVRTLLKQIEPDAGRVTLGTRLSVGEFKQIADDIDPELTVVRYLQRVIMKENPDRPLSEQEARDLAGQFLFSGRDQEKEIGVMSGGERARARLAALLASAKNVLILDEPTNHLDIPSAERLEDAIANAFDGTLILISHDRALIDATCDHLLVLDGQGNARVSHGNYSECVDRLSEPIPGSTGFQPVDQSRVRQHADPRASNAPSPPASPAPSDTTHNGAEKNRKSRHSWMPTDKLESRISELEGQIARLDETMNDPAFWTNAINAAETNAKRDELKAQLDEFEEEWLTRMD